MPSPFPGMDPFIERQEWPDFHHLTMETARELLMQHVAPRYVVRVERRIYLEHYPLEEEKPPFIIPDLTITHDDGASTGTGSTLASATAEMVECEVPMPEEQRESYLVIKDTESLQVITVIELLSPNNKRPGADGRKEYLAKREEVLGSRSHLVEIDLLRGGKRMPLLGKVPRGDYYVMTSPARRRPRVQVIAWTLRQPLPSVSIPLKGKEDATLDLQAMVQMAYDRAQYDLSINYSAPLDPPLAADEQAWVAQLLAAR